jgi:hypothetical protein
MAWREVQDPDTIDETAVIRKERNVYLFVCKN